VREERILLLGKGVAAPDKYHIGLSGCFPCKKHEEWNGEYDNCAQASRIVVNGETKMPFIDKGEGRFGRPQGNGREQDLHALATKRWGSPRSTERGKNHDTEDFTPIENFFLWKVPGRDDVGKKVRNNLEAQRPSNTIAGIETRWTGTTSQETFITK